MLARRERQARRLISGLRWLTQDHGVEIGLARKHRVGALQVGCLAAISRSCQEF